MRRWLAALAALLVAAPAAAEDVELLGTWYVLIHYKDDNAPNPDVERWDDKVWVFAKKGRSIVWTEYPIVVFDNEKSAGTPGSTRGSCTSGSPRPDRSPTSATDSR